MGPILRRPALYTLLILVALAAAACQSDAEESSAASETQAQEVQTAATVEESAAEAQAAQTVAVSAAATSAPRAVTSQAAPQQTETGTPQQTLGVDEILAAVEEVLAGLYERSLPSIVHIHVAVQADDALPFRFQQTPDDPFRRGSGSGFVWDTEGHIVTNNHVVEDAATVTVFFADGTEAKAEIVGRDPDSDLAVIKVDLPAEKLHPLPLGSSEDLRVGQFAIALGNPFGQDFTMTSGIISGLGRTISSGASPYTIPKVVQTDAPINPGNSGGPLLDGKGRVVGINTQILSRTGSSSGVGLSVPIDLAKRIVPSLIEDGAYTYPWIGIRATSVRGELAEALGLPSETRGVLVIEAVEDGPGATAGLLGSEDTVEIDGFDYPSGGDLIIAADGTTVRELEDLIIYLIEKTRPGDTISLTVLRDGGEHQIEVVLGSRPTEDDEADEG
jgi:S1-C subfamily serine protease